MPNSYNCLSKQEAAVNFTGLFLENIEKFTKLSKKSTGSHLFGSLPKLCYWKAEKG